MFHLIEEEDINTDKTEESEENIKVKALKTKLLLLKKNGKDIILSNPF
jgi:hypothetical protein